MIGVRLFSPAVIKLLLGLSVVSVFMSCSSSSGDRTQVIHSQIPSLDTKAIEASGLIFDRASGLYLLISDEVDADSPMAYLMDAKGEIKDTVPIQGVDQIDDMESISTDGQYVYVASSQSVNKKGKLKRKRNKFLRMRFFDGLLSVVDEVDLHFALAGLAETQPHRPVSNMLAQMIDEKSFEIEAHYVRDGKLFLGIKTPISSDKKVAVILIEPIAHLFSGKTMNAEFAFFLDLRDPETGKPGYLTDLIYQGERLYALSVSRKGRRKDSVLWQIPISKKKPEMIRRFEGLQAEGIALDSENRMMVVFDESGKKPSRYWLLEKH